MKTAIKTIWVTLGIVAFGIAVLCFTAKAAYASDVEIDLGASHYVDGQDGWWFQQALQHDLHMTAPAFEIAYRDELIQSGDFALNYNVGWNYLGQMHMQSMAVADSDYNPHTHECVGQCGHQSDFNGRGHDQGVRLTLEPSYSVSGVRIGFEAGAYYHMNTWSEHILDWSADNNCVQGAGHTLDVSANHKWLLGSVFGFSVAKDNFVLRYQFFKNGSPTTNVRATDFPAAWHSTQVVSIGWRF